ncbi:hypothetical protein GLW00_16315 [Halobacillus litoralis]|uniref:HNH endonuclease n=1 Tax=Halobacillus litoralis TaxID=45668 RepID=A0A845FD52_9BACI|nr:HNH endonuclease [Halobacillus litoralis]MYL72412.1 hypothetical protein [Halobacillus litoralis]
MSDYKLTIEIRKPSYAQNKTVRDSIPRSLWKAVRHHVLKKSDFQCQICGFHDEEKLHAHEVWQYDEEKYLLILNDIQPLCRSCHDLKHIHHVGHRTKAGNTSDFVMRNLKRHFIKVNDCTEKDFIRHYRNQLARSTTEPVRRSMEDLIEWRERIEKEAFLMAQDWKFVIGDNVPLASEIESNLDEKGLLYERNHKGSSSLL